MAAVVAKKNGDLSAPVIGGPKGAARAQVGQQSVDLRSLGTIIQHHVMASLGGQDGGVIALGTDRATHTLAIGAQRVLLHLRIGKSNRCRQTKDPQDGGKSSKAKHGHLLL